MNCKYDIIETADGSHTLKIKDTATTFHSTKGALQESEHVFIGTGLDHFLHNQSVRQEVHIWEVGFGTGLNALLTAIAAAKNKVSVVYRAIDLYPVPHEVYDLLNYPRLLSEPDLYKAIMQGTWGALLTLTPFFKLEKIQDNWITYPLKGKADIIYLDAFAPEDQEEMWSLAVCRKMFDSLDTGGVLVTYCSKSVVRKTLQAAGFLVHKLPGPQGKREIIRAVKI